MIEIFQKSRVVFPFPDPDSILGWPGCALALGLCLHNQLQNPPPGLLQTVSLQSVPVKTGVKRKIGSNRLHFVHMFLAQEIY